jgi:hypothetical protein
MISISPKNLKRDQMLIGKNIDARLAPKGEAILRDVRSKGIPIVVVQTWRSRLQGAINKLKGVSQTGSHSKHCCVDNHLCQAVDFAFQDAKGKIYWPPANHVWWDALGSSCKAHNMIWGGDWKMRDMGHCELK